VEWVEDLVYIYTNRKLLQKQLNTNPMTFKKKILFEYYMSNVSLSLDKGNTSKDDPLVSNEEEDQHDPLEFPTNDPPKDLSFSKLLIDVNIWE
jgi:hypothetical protein